ncbi:MAG: OmpA family protein [Salinivirgaceae bacterium]|nr:OmpA family protein [Salinivirgaceae bacterium]
MSQQVLEASGKKLKNLAQSAEILGDKYTAIEYYQQLEKEKPNTKILLKLADLYFETRNYEYAKTYYQKLNLSNNFHNQFRLALSYKNIGAYDSCIYYFDKINKEKLSYNEKVQLKKEYNGALIGYEADDNSSLIEIHHLEGQINFPHMEGSPNFLNDSLIIFSSFEANENNQYSIYDVNSIPKNQLYFAKQINGEWKRDKKLEITTGTESVSSANGCFSLDGARFYFTICNSNYQNKKICQLYVCDFKNGIFQNARKIGNEVNGSYFTSTMPSVGTVQGKNKEAIYFSSDRPGGLGGMDLWYTVYYINRDKFSEPRNLGRKINTPDDEITPFYSPKTKTLFYSTNGMVSYGGFDIYKAIGEMRSWLNPKNIGNHINSNADEIYFVLSDSRLQGFFASNRPESLDLQNEYCCFDIFQFKFTNPDYLQLKGTLLTSINPIIEKLLQNGIEFRDSTKNNHRLKNAIVSLYIKNNELGDSLYITSDTTNQLGEFDFDVDDDLSYSLIIHDDQEIKAQIDVSAEDIRNSEMSEIVIKTPVIEIMPSDPLVIKNITYEFGKSTLTENAKLRLDATLIMALKELPDIIIEISSHTDNIGDDAFNEKLSLERAKNVALYLESQGISKNRMITKGYGETQPIAANINEDGSDNPEGREKNRRTEFKILNKKASSKIKF